MDLGCSKLVLVVVGATLGASALVGCGGSEVATEAAVGECFQDPEDTSDVGELDKVDCDDAHDNEVISVFNLEGDDFPGADEVQSEAEGRCNEDFESYVGSTFEESDLDLFTISPTKETWVEADDREVICSVFALDGSSLEGTVRGTAR